MRKTIQAKQIPERPILQYLAQQTRWATWQESKPFLSIIDGTMVRTPSVRDVVPAEFPPKVLLAKMRALLRRGLVSGCGCGCRGDFVLTERGRAWLAGVPMTEGGIADVVLERDPT